MNTITIKAPAKINITLDVTGKRPNGYHDLQMIMQTIDLYDTVTITKIPENEIRFHMNKELPDKIPAEKNLVYKAAKKMKDTFSIEHGFEITLMKNIPAAAGLAGGSSDCAATIIGINQLCELSQSITQLCDIGVTLGADVPFCIQKGTLLSEGIGEILTPLPKLPALWTLLIKPNISVSTAYVYTHLSLDETTTHPDTKKMISYLEKRDIASLAQNMENVLESVTIPEYPILQQLKDYLLENGAAGSLMSGSGPTTFGLFQDEIYARMAYKKALSDYPDFDVILCQTKLPD